VIAEKLNSSANGCLHIDESQHKSLSHVFADVCCYMRNVKCMQQNNSANDNLGVQRSKCRAWRLLLSKSSDLIRISF
jgi:DNA-directed RNA polymerase subunit N (RpoN/RPB10)